MMRAANDNALLVLTMRRSRTRRAIECAAWMLAYGVVIGALWYSAYAAGPFLRSLG